MPSSRYEGLHLQGSRRGGHFPPWRFTRIPPRLKTFDSPASSRCRVSFTLIVMALAADGLASTRMSSWVMSRTSECPQYRRSRRLSENYDSQSFGPRGGMSILIQTSHRLRRGDTKPPFIGSGPLKNAISFLVHCPLVGLARILHAPIAPDLEQIMG